jgi:hypothetical protein
VIFSTKENTGFIPFPVEMETDHLCSRFSVFLFLFFAVCSRRERGDHGKIIGWERERERDKSGKREKRERCQRI